VIGTIVPIAMPRSISGWLRVDGRPLSSPVQWRIHWPHPPETGWMPQIDREEGLRRTWPKLLNES